jgi:hypothetical protein
MKCVFSAVAAPIEAASQGLFAARFHRTPFVKRAVEQRKAYAMHSMTL